MRRVLGLMIIAVCVAAIPALDTAFAADPNGHYKLDMCHFDDGGSGKIINVSGRAADAHLRNHGDLVIPWYKPMGEKHCVTSIRIPVCVGGTIDWPLANPAPQNPPVAPVWEQPGNCIATRDDRPGDDCSCG